MRSEHDMIWEYSDSPVYCICGWIGGSGDILEDAEDMYADHIAGVYEG